MHGHPFGFRACLLWRRRGERHPLRQVREAAFFCKRRVRLTRFAGRWHVAPRLGVAIDVGSLPKSSDQATLLPWRMCHPGSAHCSVGRLARQTKTQNPWASQADALKGSFREMRRVALGIAAATRRDVVQKR